MMSSAYTIILAGGQGQRLGGVDKGEIRLGEPRMIDVIAERLRGQGARLKISGSHDYGLNVTIIPDRDDGPDQGPKGPVAGLYAAYRALENSGGIGFFTVPVDGPNVPDDLLSRLCHYDGSAIAADAAGLHPTFAWWRLGDLREVFSDMDFTRSISLTRVAALTQARHINWPGEQYFVNINTADELADYVSTA